MSEDENYEPTTDPHETCRRMLREKDAEIERLRTAIHGLHGLFAGEGTVDIEALNQTLIAEGLDAIVLPSIVTADITRLEDALEAFVVTGSLDSLEG